ncbi:MAG: ComEC/Rec2 family competence protein [Oscillospiraceae bacterium]
MRKLGLCALGYVSALLFAHYILPPGALLWCAAALAFCCCAAFVFRGTARLRILIICLSAACGMAWYWGYGCLVSAKIAEVDGVAAEVVACVTDYPTEGDFPSLRVRLIGGEASGVNAVIYDYGVGIGDLRPGDIITAEMKLFDAALRFGEETDIYSSRGLFLRGYLRSAPEVTGRSPLAFMYFPRSMAKAVRDTSAEIFPEDAAPFMRALLIGDKSELYEDNALYTALGRAGILHIVAVSGMHLSFLYGFIALAARSKRRAAALSIPALWLFALMAGMTPSVVRSAFMLTMTMAAPFLRRETDGLTSLSAPLLLMTVLNPRAVASVSLQLSFAAMAGIILIAPRVYAWSAEKWKKPKKRGGKFRRLVIASFASSIGAIVFTAPVGAMHFGYVSLVSPLTNLLVMSVISFCFLGGYGAVLLGVLWTPLGVAAAWLVAWAARYVFLVCETLSSLSFAAVYTVDKLIVLWLIFSYAVFAIAYYRRGKAPFRPIAPTCVSVIALSAVLISSALLNLSVASATVIDVGQGQCVAIFSGASTAVIDCGGSCDRGAGDTAADYLDSCGRTHIDALILTHLHADHADGVAQLMSRIKVSRLLLPEDAEDDRLLLPDILAAAAEHGTEVIYVSVDTAVSFPEASLRILPPMQAGETNERGLLILASVGDYDLLVTGDVNSTVEKRLAETGVLPDGELLIVGHHGSRYSTCYELLDAFRAETAVISVGANNYGHPTDEVLWRLASRGMDIYRTDFSGNVTVRIN